MTKSNEKVDMREGRAVRGGNAAFEDLSYTIPDKLIMAASSGSMQANTSLGAV